jgi:hypothetical protein
MQHIHTQDLYFEGHATLWRAVKYLSLLLAGLIAIFEHSPALLIVLAIAYVMVLALIERARNHDSASSLPPHNAASRLLGDGGCFPGAEPEEERAVSMTASSVLDGGSLEHHRS